MTATESLLLVLTGTITPSPGAEIVRKDPALRRADYINAFTYWLKHPDLRLNKILFIENSGADLSDFHAAAAASPKEVEIISVPPNPPPPKMNYGYSELQMMDQAFEQSRLRNSTTHMVKVTGRLIFPCLPKLLNKLPNAFELVADARSRLPFRKCEGNGFIPSQLFLSRHEFYDITLRKGYSMLAPAFHYPHFIEYLFFDLLTPKKNQPGVYLRFPINCEPVGFAGHAAKQYDSSSRSLITTARALTRIVAPRFWL